MPVVEVHLIEGYSPEAKSRLMTALTRAVRLVVPAPDEAITVLATDHPPQNYARGGQSRSPAPALPDPEALVRAYLARMEDRDLVGAEAMLAEGFEMRFPGTAPMHSLQELIDWAAPRYRWVTKSFDSIESFQGADGAVVYTRGTLSGQWPDGTAFDSIRFVDRFELRAGKITRQDVWNDIAEARAQ